MKNWIAFTVCALIVTAISVWGFKFIQNTQEKALEAQLTASLLDNAVMKIAPTNEHSVSFVLVGDSMLSRAVGRIMERTGDYALPFKEAASFLSAADIAVGNLEGPISDEGANQGSIYSFRADPRAVEGLTIASFDVLSLANNHIWDWGVPALIDTVRHLQKADIVAVGAGANKESANELKIVERNGVRVGFLAYTNLYPRSLWATEVGPGISAWTKESLLARVAEIKNKKEADIIVVLPHWGEEYDTNANDDQKEFAHALIDAGADIIAGHHPHVVQEMEQYLSPRSGQVGVIFYSLGNFVFDQTFSSETMEAGVGKVVWRKGVIEEASLERFPINKSFQPVLK